MNVVVDSTVVLNSPVVDSVEEVDNVVMLVTFLNIYKRRFSFLVETSCRTFSGYVRNNELDIETTVVLNRYPAKRRNSATEL